MNLFFSKINVIGLSLIALLLLFTACTEDSILDKTRKVSGVVTDQATGKPLDGVWVILIADDDNILFPSHEVKSVMTDATGKFEITYERVEDTYRVEVSKPWYTYRKFSKGKNGFPDAYADFQTLEYFKKEENIAFPMYALGTLEVKLQNAAPAASSDVIALTCPNCESEKDGLVRAPRVYTSKGTQDQTLMLGTVAANTYLRLKYKVTHNGQTQELKDSVYVQPFVLNNFDLHY
ncbi:carboxypeptidase-like regulatory domain-containing protein [Adhaeribacter rhizoryzae]|uniref:Carboxypeptidase regulatory-like domain-containing protein n=1 Tax=Adhaeribacter rhizoryzae TaxID=2607907 RepID=A0A5M6DE14_9BACT|nr:carboxypeptidase-like regulatory domain-containing protein [Adhaeribacter rhizoryzae]KAA5545633.1 carboxypeptidase regulatory-like domain-containing protein [Adhaeribacter rhizoryzae]